MNRVQPVTSLLSSDSSCSHAHRVAMRHRASAEYMESSRAPLPYARVSACSGRITVNSTWYRNCLLLSSSACRVSLVRRNGSFRTDSFSSYICTNGEMKLTWKWNEFEDR